MWLGFKNISFIYILKISVAKIAANRVPSCGLCDDMARIE